MSPLTVGCFFDTFVAARSHMHMCVLVQSDGGQERGSSIQPLPAGVMMTFKDTAIVSALATTTLMVSVGHMYSHMFSEMYVQVFTECVDGSQALTVDGS